MTLGIAPLSAHEGQLLPFQFAREDSEKKLIDNDDVLSLSIDPTGPSDYPNS